MPVRITISVLALAWLSPVLLAQTPTDRLPVPDKAAQTAVLDHLHIIYKDDYAKARKDVAARGALAFRLLEVSRQKAALPNDRFVQLREARDLAANALDIGVAFQAAEEMAQHFAVNALDMKIDGLASTLAGEVPPETGRNLTQVALSLMQDSLDRDDFDQALRLGKFAESAASKSKDKALAAETAQRSRDVLALHQAFTRLEAVRQRLARNPDDGAANLEMGKYLGQAKGNWEKGLFYLAQANDSALRLLAQRDLSRPEDPKEQLHLADTWWDLAEKAQGAERVHLQQRAVFWYEQAIGSTRGFQRGRLEERIASVPRPFVSLVGWDYNGKPGPLGAPLTGHNGVIYGVAFSPDGKKVLSGSIDQRGALWEVATGKQLVWLQGHRGMIWGVAYSPDGKHVFTSSWDGTVKMWDAARGVEVRGFPAQGRLADMNGVALSRDGKQLLTGADDGIVRLWDTATGQEVRQFSGHRGFVYGVAFSPDGKRALSGGCHDSQMILWDLQTGKELRRFPGLPGQLRTVAFSPDGRNAVNSGGSDVTLWDLQTGQAVRQFRGHAGVINAAVFSPDGRRLATGGSDQTIRLWDVASGREVYRMDNCHPGGVFSLAFSPGGGRLVSGGQDNTVRLWGLPR